MGNRQPYFPSEVTAWTAGYRESVYRREDLLRRLVNAKVQRLRGQARPVLLSCRTNALPPRRRRTAVNNSCCRQRQHVGGHAKRLCSLPSSHTIIDRHNKGHRPRREKRELDSLLAKQGHQRSPRPELDVSAAPREAPMTVQSHGEEIASFLPGAFRWVPVRQVEDKNSRLSCQACSEPGE